MLNQAVLQRCASNLAHHSRHACSQAQALTTPQLWGLQVLKSKERPLVSSVFFMCLPDKVGVGAVTLASTLHKVL